MDMEDQMQLVRSEVTLLGKQKQRVGGTSFGGQERSL